MSLNKLEFRMAIPAVTQKYTPGSRRNSRKPMRLPHRCDMRPDSPALGAEQFRLPSKHERSLDLLDGTLDSPPESPHPSQRTLMSPKKCEIARCSPNQLEIKPDSLHWIQSNFLFPVIHDKWLDFL